MLARGRGHQAGPSQAQAQCEHSEDQSGDFQATTEVEAAVQWVSGTDTSRFSLP